MKVKRQKQTRRHVRFFRVCFAFREPFKCLCDGNFCHHLARLQLGEPAALLSRLLGGAVKPMVTRCILAELRLLGEGFDNSLQAASSLMVARCGHDSPLTAAECIKAVVGVANTEHLFVASQDVELRRHFRKIPGGALIFAQGTSLAVEPPSEQQQKLAVQSESQRLQPSTREHRLLSSSTRKMDDSILLDKEMTGDAGAGALRGDDSAAKESQPERGPREAAINLGLTKQGTVGVKGQRNADGGSAVFKRKAAKGPNPLSRLKAKKQQKPSAEASSIPKQLEGGQIRKRARKRARKTSEAGA